MLVANEKWLPYSGKQTADTKWKTKQLKPPQNPKQLPTCKHKVGKNNNNKNHQITRVS